jgi:hypothetical protein
MAEISKQALKVENNTSFPNNNVGAITPAILRAFNVDMIDSLVDEQTYTSDSASWNQQIDALEQFTASASGLTTGSLLLTASAAGNVITFTKGNNTQFSITVDTGSGGGGDLTSLNQATASLQAFTASATIRLNNLESTTASLLVETSNLETFSASALVSISNLNQSSASQQVSINALNSATASYVTEAESGSFLITASFDNGSRNLTFTKGNNTTFAVNIPDVSGSAGNFVTTSSFNAYTASNDQRVGSLEVNSASVNISISNINQTTASLLIETANLETFSASALVSISNLNASSASQQVSINALNVFTASQSTASLVTSITNLNNFTSSANVRLNNLESTSASVNTSISNINGFTSSANQRLTAIESVSGSWITESETASFARTNVDNNFTANQTFTNITAISASFTYVQTLFETASVIYSSGSNQFGDELTDTQTLSGSVKVQGSLTVNGVPVQTSSVDISALNQATASLQAFTQSAEVRLNNIESTTASLNTSVSNLNTFSASALVSINALNAATNSYVTETESGSFLITASFASQTLTFTKGDNTTFSVTIPDVSGSTIDTASFATTGSNTFTGDQTFTDASDNFFTITDTSGSMMLVAKGFTSASAHITSSAASKVNIIFKNNNNTGTIYLSGSNNIFTNPDTPTTGFKRILGNNNINLFIATPQVSASMGDYVSIDNNFLTARNTSPITVRGPISSSAWEIKGNVLTQQLNIGTSAANHAQGLVSGLLVNNCYIGANLSVIANRSNTTQATTISNSNFAGAVSLVMASSSIDFINNITAGGTITINNNTTGSARVSINQTNAVFVASNILGGNTTMTLSGSNDPNDAQDIDYNGGIVRSLIHGSSIAVRVNTGLTGSNTLSATTIIGNNLIVTGSSQNALTTGGTNFGSAFFGRYNSVDGNKALSADTVFAVGAGSNLTTRKTPLRVSSSAMVLFEGETNFSGNITFTDRSGYNNNVYLGSDALGMGTSGAQPLAFGNTIAVAIGNGAMRYASGSNQNTAIGNNALLITTGSKNTAIGSEALSDNTTGAQNFALGVSALTSNTTGQDNVAIGNSAIFNHTIGSGQVAIGNNALLAMTNDAGSNGQNMAIGGDAMANVITASLNVAIGAGVLRDVRYANENVFIGHNSGINTSGSVASNVVIGGRAGQKMAGNDNTIIGHSAGGDLVNGASNTFIGKNAGVSVITGSYNTLIGGTLSGQDNWNNVVAISDGQNNIKFYNSGSQTTLTNNTLISGSLTVTGSTVLSGSFYIQSGSNLPNGTTERVLTYDTTTGQVRQATLASILSASFDAAEFYSTTTQSGSAGVSGSITFNNSGSVAGVSLANNTQVTVSQAGTYNIQFSAQIETSAGADTVHIWFKKNGTNIAASASKALLANNTAQIMTVNLFDEAVANDYYELAYQTTNGHATILAEVASGNIPAIPSVILTIQQIR